MQAQLKEISTDAAVAAVLSELLGIFPSIKEQRTELVEKVFSLCS